MLFPDGRTMVIYGRLGGASPVQARSMTERTTLTDPSAPDFPTVVVEDVTVVVEWNGAAFRCSADAAHVLSDRLFQAALAIERRLMERDGTLPD